MRRGARCTRVNLVNSQLPTIQLPTIQVPTIQVPTRITLGVWELEIGNWRQSITPSRNHLSEWRSRKSRYVGPSASATSHSSRSQPPLTCPRGGCPAPASHHPPDVRHGPALELIAPPLKPRCTIETLDGLPCCRWTRMGSGWRNRRSATIGATSAFTTHRPSTLLGTP